MIGIDTNVLVLIELQEIPQHGAAQALFRREVLERGEVVALAPQLLTEFIHVVTDARRFKKPLTMEEALERADAWWNMREVTHVFPTTASTALFLQWLKTHGLGRKRLLDTHLAATYWASNVHRIMTHNPRDFSIFGGFELLVP